MKRISIAFKLLTLFYCGLAFAQEDNIFLQRAFWKTNPDIATVENKIAEGHDIAALNNGAFDPVTFALLERVDTKTIKHLLSKEGNEVDKITHDSRTYLFWAAYRGNLEIMQFLIDKGAQTNVYDSHGNTPINFIATSGQKNTAVYDFLIANGVNLQQGNLRTGANALHLLSPFLEDDRMVNYFTAKGIDLHSTDVDGNGIFNYAVQKGNISFLELLVNKGVNYTEQNNNGGNAQLFAAEGHRRNSNSIEVFRYLESIGIAPTVSNEDKQTPLHKLALRNNEAEVFKYFLNKGIDVNQKDTFGNTALMYAVQNNSLQIVRLLTAGALDINTTNNKGQSALTLALDNKDISILRFLIEKGASVNIKDKAGNSLAFYLLDTFKTANEALFYEKFNVLENGGFTFSIQEAKGNTLWHLAVKKENTALMAFIQKLNIPINLKNTDGLTPLHLAAMQADSEAPLKYLIANGADIAIRTDFEETVLDLANENEMLAQSEVNLNFLKLNK